MQVVGAVMLSRTKKPRLDSGLSAQAPGRLQIGTEGEQRRSERQPDVVERRGGGEKGALRVRRQQEDESSLRDLHDGPHRRSAQLRAHPPGLLAAA